MDIKKDTQGVNALTTGFRSDVNAMTGRDGAQRGLVSNGMEAFGASLSKRSERLATALYLVTNFLSDTEPLKARLRALSLDLVREAGSVRYGTSALEASVLDALKKIISETMGLLELAFIAGLISEMNFTILKREYVSLRDAIDIKKASRESRTDAVLGDTFFGQPFTVEGKVHERGVPTTKLALESKSIVEEKRTIVRGEKVAQGHPIGRSASQGDTREREEGMSPAKDTPLKTTPQGQANTPTRTTVAPNVNKDSRRARIVKLVKDNREVGIKDIVAYFPDISEKTIQRELVSLTESGVLKKFGERRWSRYALA